MANALCPREVSAGRWWVAERSRANGRMKEGVWRNTPATGVRWPETSTEDGYANLNAKIGKRALSYVQKLAEVI